MTADPDPIATYSEQASVLTARYETIDPETIHAPYVDMIAGGPGLALDIGAGSGRDAAWLAGRGYQVVAVEPAEGMRREGRALHADKPVRWLNDRLPALIETHRLGLAFDLILMSAVWMHLLPGDRERAFRKIVTLLKPGCVLLMTLRHGPEEPGRPMYPTSAGEIERLARAHGLIVMRSIAAPDRLERPDVSWTAMALRLPDDGAGALPLLRGIIINDNKSSTYKLALLRSIARIADGAPALAIERVDEDAVDVPLGLVALNWVRQFLPLIAARLPQAPGNAGPDGLGFAKAGFRALSPLGIAAQDLRIGAEFTGERAQAVAKALVEARNTIADMPAHFTRYPNSETPVFDATRARLGRLAATLSLDSASLRAFGTVRVPGHVWRSMQRLGAWVEPVLVGEWARMMREYGERSGQNIAPGVAEAALTWLEPARDTAIARLAARRAFESGSRVRCVWTGAVLKPDAIDIDHCFPWSAWPCGDLWNLMPASRQVNQRLKRDLIPSASALAAARELIITWWEQAWRHDQALGNRFSREAAAALPIGADAGDEDIFAAVEWRRLRLQQDQQLNEWGGR